MTSPTAPTSRNDLRPDGHHAGIALLIFAALTVAALANHPAGAARTFVDTVREEAVNSRLDALVHGGFIAVLAGQLVCLTIMTVRLGLDRPLSIAGLVLTSIGAGFLMESMLLDGLVTPAVAARFLGVIEITERQNNAKALFVLLGTTVSFLMPAGLILQAAGLACWSPMLMRRRGLARAAGVCGAFAAIAVSTGIVATGAMVPHLLIAAILVVAAAYALLGIALTRRVL